MNSENADEKKTDEENISASSKEDSFASLLEESVNEPSVLKPGQKISTRVISVSDDFIYIALPGKTDGVIDSKEFSDENGNINISEGDEVQAYFLSVKNGVKKLTTLIHGYPAQKVNAIRESHKAGVPIEGKVKREIKGGFEISVGEVRCFCPFSQIDFKGGREGGVYLGQTFPFMVIEFGEEGRNIVLSRRVLLEQEKQAQLDRLKASLEIGTVVTAEVSSIQRFGAFIDLGGVDGLIPASELSWTRVDKPSDLLTVGQKVTAKVIALDWDTNRLTLSLKAMKEDPWKAVSEKYSVDSKVTGTIVRLAPFGAFVNLEEGIDGLIHISNLGAGKRINHPKEIVQVGQHVEATVLGVDEKGRKISLSLKPKVEPKKIVLPEIDEVVEGVVEKVAPFGIFLKLSSGITGLIPNSEIGIDGADSKKESFKPGTKLEAIVVETDQQSKKIRLSVKAIADRKVRQEYEEYISSSKKPEASGLGSLGEILKAKLEEKKQDK